MNRAYAPSVLKKRTAVVVTSFKMTASAKPVKNTVNNLSPEIQALRNHMNVKTINLKGNEYATVPQRLKQFREDNPRAKITTSPEFLPDGTIVFLATIVSDKASETSSEATGHSYGPNTGDKSFEKLETVAVGRALSILGYLNNGQVASTEEMFEFEEYKADQYELALKEIKNATKREDFTAILAKLSPTQKQLAAPVINERIKELKEQTDGNTSKS